MPDSVQPDPRTRPAPVPAATAPGRMLPAGVGLPWWTVLPAVLAVAFLALPLIALLVRAAWADLPELLGSPAARAALGLSLRTALMATGLCLLLGVPLALLLARGRFPGQAIVRGLVLLPLVLPPVVAGIALLYTFGRRGLLGQTLEVAGLRVAFSTAAVVLAEAFVAMPFLVISLESALRVSGQKYEEMAATLGASPTVALRRVTLPLLAPALVAGTVLCFARALGEFGATITFAGSVAGVTRTLPLEIYLQREVDPDAAVALSLLLVVVSGIVMGIAWTGERRRLGAQSAGALRPGGGR